VLAVALSAAALLAIPPRPGAARLVHVPPLEGAAARALAAAAPGDTLVLGAGVHRGPLVVDRRVVLRGEPGAVLEGGGRGTVLTVRAGGSAILDLEVRGSGRRVLTADAGVRVVEASEVRLERLRLRDVLYGIYGERAPRLAVAACSLQGRVAPLDEAGEGNGIHLWFSDDARLAGNRVERFLDGVYLSFAHRARVENGLYRDCGRYGLHTMYCQEGVLEGNTFTRNVAGCAIMFSNALRVEGNDFVRNRGPRTYGLLLRDCSAGAFRGNRLVDNTVAMFLDNSNRNRIEDNLLQDNGWGLLLFSSCAGNVVAGNDFIHNDYPVALDMRRTDNRFDDGRRGNYWSDNTPYDLDGDGVSDAPYSPVSAFAFVSKQYPDLSILARSPAVAALAAAERAFPALRPSEAVDRAPLASPAGRSRRPLPAAAGGVQPAWSAVVGCALLALVSAAGVLGARRA
jgi:nitrous oxidase accessory protein